MSEHKDKRSDQIAADQAMIAGIQKFFGTFSQLTVGSQTLTPAALVQVFQDRVNANLAAQTAEAARTTAVQANRAERAQTAALVRSFRQLVQATYAQSPDTLAVFALTPHKVTVKTAEQKAEAAAKARATRAARHTMGSKQKKGITGATPVPTDNGGAATGPGAPTPPKT